MEGYALEEAWAFSPAHITGFFQIFDRSPDPLKKGSTGAGVNLESGVLTRVTFRNSAEKTIHVDLNGDPLPDPVVDEHVINFYLQSLRKQGEVRVSHWSRLQLGAGFGLSAAAALGVSLALNEALGAKLTYNRASQLAHVAEVNNLTGLGDVISQVHGGLEVRVRPGAPSVGKLDRIPVDGDLAVTAACFRIYPTRAFLTDKRLRARIRHEGGTALARLLENPTPEEFVLASARFMLRVDASAPDFLKRLMAKARRYGALGASFKKGVVFALVEQSKLNGVMSLFGQMFPAERLVTSRINFSGARLLSESEAQRTLKSLLKQQH